MLLGYKKKTGIFQPVFLHFCLRPFFIALRFLEPIFRRPLRGRFLCGCGIFTPMIKEQFYYEPVYIMSTIKRFYTVLIKSDTFFITPHCECFKYFFLIKCIQSFTCLFVKLTVHISSRCNKLLNQELAVMLITKTVKKIVRNTARFSNKSNHITVLHSVHFSVVVNIYNSGNTSVLQGVLTERTRFSVLILTSFRARSVIKAIKINFATICTISQLAQQINFSVHRTLEHTLSTRITALVDTEVNNLATLHSKGDNLMLQSIISEFRCDAFSDLLQTTNTSYSSLLLTRKGH